MSFTNAYAANNPEDEKAALAATVMKLHAHMNSYDSWMSDVNAEAGRLGLHFNNGLEAVTWGLEQTVKSHPEIFTKTTVITGEGATTNTGSSATDTGSTDSNISNSGNPDSTNVNKNGTLLTSGNIKDSTTNAESTTTQTSSIESNVRNAGNTDSADKNNTSITSGNNPASNIIKNRDSKDGVTVVTSGTALQRDNDEIKPESVISHHMRWAEKIKLMNSMKSYTDYRFNRAESQIKVNSRAIKRLGATAEAAANLHYNANNSGYAIAAGEYNGESALAAGIQFRTGQSTAITVQASYDAESTGGSAGFHGDF